MKIILLTKGLISLVDDCDYEWLSNYSWFAHQKEEDGAFYAATKIRLPNGKRRSMDMHRMILGLVPGDGKIADHIEPSETLDNRRRNLRVADVFQSNYNQSLRKDNTSGHKGVKWEKSRNRWNVNVQYGGKNHHGGSFVDFAAACARRDELARELHGEFARS